MSELVALLEEAKHCIRLALQMKEPDGKRQLIARAQDLTDQAEALARQQLEQPPRRSGGKGH